MDPLANQQDFQQALLHHQVGRLAEAEQLYRKVLSQQPEHVDALHNLGLLAHQLGRNDAAIELIQCAIALKPTVAEFYCNLGDALGDAGRSKEAIAAYRQAIVLRPNHAETYGNLGVILRAAGRLDDAIAAYRQAISLKPNFAEAYTNLGNALREKGRLDEAAAAHRRAVDLRPGLPEAHFNLGIVLKDQNQVQEAITAFRRAVSLRPDYIRALTNLANELRNTGELDESIAAYNRLLAIRPTRAETHSNLGLALEDAGRLDEAIAEYRRGIALKPDLAGAHSNLGMALLLRGDWQQGWPEYEWRFQVPDTTQDKPVAPRWDGGELNGRTLLLFAEQGLGDTIHFIRYLPRVAQYGGRVLIEAPEPLIRLLRQLPGAEQWIPKGQPLPQFDVQCPLMSLPGIFGTTPSTIPPLNDLLRPDPELAEAWHRRLQQQPPGLRVGLAWAGSKKHKNDRNRSIPLSLLAPLAAPGVQFYSLQKGDATAQATQASGQMSITDWTQELHDFADTAALIDQLDLIISVDTAVAHLSAAMGKPTWLLLPFVPDWRWLRDREDTPWYPSMRLFRQTKIGDWPDVIQRAAGALADLAARKPIC
jgi:tetratricopeptide (TPR) repeat protein